MFLAFKNINHITERNVAIGILVVTIAALIHIFRHPFWGVRLRGFFRRPLAIMALIIALFFFATAWMDAIAWKDTIADGAEGVSLDARESRSLLDRAFAAVAGVPEYEYRERSYSAPLADHEFVDTEIKLTYRHLMGTSQTGHDTLFKIMKGCKPAVVIGVLPLIVAIPLALLFGITAGFFGGRTDDLVVYLYTTLASIPGLLLMIALITVLGQGLLQISVGLGVTGWIGLCRLVRGETLKLRELEYVQAATCLGVSPGRIIMRHILPNLMHVVVITAILAFTGLVLTESVLSYIGIGLEHSWGAMIDHARGELAREPVIWWNIVFASIALFILVLSVNIVGDAVRDVLDPRLTIHD